MQQEKASNLNKVWEPLKLGDLTLRNRILQPAHSSQHGDPRDHTFSKSQIAYFRERAKGGVGLSITETVAAARSAVGSFFNVVDVWSPKCIPSMRELSHAVHEYGGHIMVQLASMGVHDRGRMFVDQTKPIWGASRIPSLMHNEMPLVMGSYEIDELVEDFGQAAINCRTAGIDGVELHGAHSYGLGQFLSPTYNKRTDGYGGSPTKRCRLLIECAQSVRKRVGENYVIGVRLSWDEFLGAEGGITPEQSEEQIDVLATSGLFNFFNISAGGYHTIHLALPSMEDPSGEGWLEGYSKKAKEIVGDRGKVFVAGKIRDLHKAEEILLNESADMVAIARQLLADAHTVRKTKEGREHEIILCNRCNECAGRLWEHRELVCALNPVSGREAYWGEGTLEMVQEHEAKSIVVVGGGPAGMKAAAVAAARGHKVSLLEETESLGGHLRLLQQLPGLGDWSIAIDNLQREMNNYGVTVEMGMAATPSNLKSRDPDAICFATGSHFEKTGLSLYRPDRETIPGAHNEWVMDVEQAAWAVLGDAHALGGNILILDETGTPLPFAVAEVLAESGASVEIMSPRMYAGEKLYRNLDMLYIFPRLKKLGVKITNQYFVDSIGENSVDVYDIWAGSQALETRSNIDTVILSILRLANDGLYFNSVEHFEEIYRIGDMVAPRDVTAVIHEGEKFGRTV
jgi:2,4-dienoyl-CoA reductase-like NADH-dependent reductase (Old Yellow Enzyme family)